MKKQAADPTTKIDSGSDLPQLNNVGLLLLDTSARLFVPSVGGTVLGLWGDKSWGTTPWLTVAGVTLGSCLAIALVYSQIHTINKSSHYKDKGGQK